MRRLFLSQLLLLLLLFITEILALHNLSSGLNVVSHISAGFQEIPSLLVNYEESGYLRRRQLNIAETGKYKLLKCKDGGEAYSAAYLITKEHLLYQFTDYNLTWVNCEMGSFIMMGSRVNPFKENNGSLLMSQDVLDFSVIHLSAYERLLLRWARSAKEINADKDNIKPVVLASEFLKTFALQMRNPLIPPAHRAFNRTIVIMPYLGVDRGAGHSKLYNRQIYLNACFWSYYAYFPYIVAGVKSIKDRDYLL
jgi:hypothetical protein